MQGNLLHFGRFTASFEIAESNSKDLLGEEVASSSDLSFGVLGPKMNNLQVDLPLMASKALEIDDHLQQ